MTHKLIILLAACLFMTHSSAHAKYQAEFTPAISISELYDDNIDLDNTNEKTDWITTVSPSINLNLISEKNNFSLKYSPSIVRYKNEEQNNAIRHSGTLMFNENLTSRFSFNLNDTFTRTEDPVEETQGIYNVRKTRNIYTRNNGTAGMRYIFGPENSFSLTFNHSMLKNEDTTLEDNISSNPSAGLAYWFNTNNGVELNYQYTDVKYSRGDERITGDDYSGNTAAIKYLYRFSTHTTTFLGYTFNSREFENKTDNYDIHDGSIGLTHSFSNNVSLSLSGGYFKLKNDVPGDDNGYSYNVSLSKKFSRGNISLGGIGGWRESFLEAERQGLSKYWTLNTAFDYQILERLSNYAGLSYMLDKNEQDYKYSTYRANYGWRVTFLKWFSLAIDYSRSTRKDDITINDYNDNRIMMTLSAGKVFK